MYDSLREWCVFPVTIYPVEGRTPGGDPRFGEVKQVKGYIAEVIETIEDKLGKEVISKSRIYLPPEIAVGDSDKIAIFNEPPRDILLIRKWYDGNTAKASVQVVYL